MMRRPLKLATLEECISEVQRLRDGGYDPIGTWNLAMVCHHLTKTMRMSLEGASFGLPFFARPIARFLLLGKVMRGEPTKLKAKTSPTLLPDESLEISDSIDQFEQAAVNVAAANAPLINTHPIFGKFSAEQWRRFHAWHAAHHLSFLIPHCTADESPRSVPAPQTHASTSRERLS